MDGNINNNNSNNSVTQHAVVYDICAKTIASSLDGIYKDLEQLKRYWKNNVKNQGLDKDTKGWKDYNLYDCVEVCAQEAKRVLDCISRMSEEDWNSGKSVIELEHKYGLWQPYASDDSDDEDWTEETGPYKKKDCLYDEEEFFSEESEEDEDVEIVEW